MNWAVVAMTASTSVDVLAFDLRTFIIVMIIGVVLAFSVCMGLIAKSHTKQKATSVSKYDTELKVVRNSDVDTGERRAFKSNSSTPTRKKESYVAAEQQKQMLADTAGEFSEGLGLGQADKVKDKATQVLGKFMGRGE